MKVSCAPVVSTTLTSSRNASPLRRVESGPRPMLTAPREGGRIEDQHDLAVAQIRSARDPLDAPQRIGDRAHHNLALSHDLIDGEPDRARSGPDHEHVK